MERIKIKFIFLVFTLIVISGCNRSDALLSNTTGYVKNWENSDGSTFQQTVLHSGDEFVVLAQGNQSEDETPVFVIIYSGLFAGFCDQPFLSLEGRNRLTKLRKGKIESAKIDKNGEILEFNYTGDQIVEIKDHEKTVRVITLGESEEAYLDKRSGEILGFANTEAGFTSFLTSVEKGPALDDSLIEYAKKNCDPGPTQ